MGEKKSQGTKTLRNGGIWIRRPDREILSPSIAILNTTKSFYSSGTIHKNTGTIEQKSLFQGIESIKMILDKGDDDDVAITERLNDLQQKQDKKQQLKNGLKKSDIGNIKEYVPKHQGRGCSGSNKKPDNRSSSH
jgi:ABC-type antimicrobial peptide transport system permease subunit